MHAYIENNAIRYNYHNSDYFLCNALKEKSNSYGKPKNNSSKQTCLCNNVDVDYDNSNIITRFYVSSIFN